MDQFDLDTKLMQFGTGDALSEPYCIKHSLLNCQVFGSNGSGKSSSMKTWALKLLRAGYGFLVLSVKSERETWEEYCRLAGRSDDLIIIGENSPHRFDFMRYLSNSQSPAALTNNLLDILTTVIKQGDEVEGGTSADPYWEKSLRSLLYHTISLCQLSAGKVSIQNLYDIIQSAPQSDENGELNNTNPNSAFNKTYNALQKEIATEYQEWRDNWSDYEQKWFEDRDRLEAAIIKRFPKARPFKFIEQYFYETFKTLSQKTRSIIVQSATNFLFSLLMDPAYELFCNGQLTVKPDDTWTQGKIILLDLPTKFYHSSGRFCQLAFKYIWQLQVEKRDVKKYPRPVCLWVDESSQFLTDFDSLFASTSRSSRVAMVYIAQNIHQYYSAVAGPKAQDRVASFLGLMCTKIFFSNAEVSTNKYASDLISDGLYIEPSRSITTAENFSQTDSFSLKFDKLVRPEAFTRLATGGLPHCTVEGYIHVQGEKLFSGQNFKKIKFNQNYK